MARRPPAASPMTLIWVALIVGLALTIAWVANPSLDEPSDPQANAAELLPEPATADSSESASASSVPEAVNGDEDAGRQAVATPTSASADDAFGWVGVVRNREGLPMANIAVRWITPWSLTEGELPRTDAEGRFFLPYSPTAEWPDEQRAGISLVDAELRPTLARVPPPASPPAEVELVADAVETWLPVRVVEMDGITPRAKLPVTLRGGASFDLGTTDEQGRTRLRGVSGERLTLDVYTHIFCWLNAPDPLILQPGENPELVVQYEGTPIAISLRAHDVTSHQPLTQVDWYGLTDERNERERLLATSAPDFAWSLEEHGSLAGYCGMRIYAEGYLPTHFEWTGMAPQDGVSIPMVREEAWPVQLELSRGGVPIAEKSVRISADGPYMDNRSLERVDEPLLFGAFSGLELTAETQTDALGNARLELPWNSIAPQPKRIHLQVDGEDHWLNPSLLGPQPWVIDFAPALATVIFSFPDNESESSVDLWLDAGPQAPLLYQARTHRYNVNPSTRPYWADPDRQGVADEHGELRFEIPAHVAFRWARTSSSELRQLDAVPPLAPGAVHRIEVGAQQSGRIAGKILRADGREWDGQTLALTLKTSDGEVPLGSNGEVARWASGRTRYGTGDFEFFNVPPGVWHLDIWGVRIAESPVLVEAGQEDLRVKLEALCLLDLHVVDAATGDAVEGEINAYVRGGSNGLSWSTIWNGSGQLEFSAGPELQVSLDATGYRAQLVSLGDVLIPGTKLLRRVELQRGREIRLHVQPPGAVEDGRFAGVRVLDATGQEISDYPVSYRTTAGRVILHSAPREALQVHFVIRGTRDTLFFCEVPAAKPEATEPTRVDVRWPDDDSRDADND